MIFGFLINWSCFFIQMTVSKARDLHLTLYTWDTRGGKHKKYSYATLNLPTLLQGRKPETPFAERLAIRLEPKGTLYVKVRVSTTRSSCLRVAFDRTVAITLVSTSKIALEENPSSPGPLVFGADLQSIVDREKSGLSVPTLVHACIEEVEKRGSQVLWHQTILWDIKRPNRLYTSHGTALARMNAQSRAVANSVHTYRVKTSLPWRWHVVKRIQRVGRNAFADTVAGSAGAAFGDTRPARLKDVLVASDLSSCMRDTVEQGSAWLKRAIPLFARRTLRRSAQWSWLLYFIQLQSRLAHLPCMRVFQAWLRTKVTADV